MSKNLWFKRKTYGWGWTPASWQGWLSLAIYLGLVFLPLGKPIPAIFPGTLGFFLYEAGCVAALMILCYSKGEKPRWQWGEK